MMGKDRTKGRKEEGKVGHGTQSGEVVVGKMGGERVEAAKLK
jgi:hypothetical protein